MDLPAHLSKPKLCSLRKWETFSGYGFNLHSEKGKPGQFIGRVDPNSPAQFGGLLANDVLIEVNGVNVDDASHNIAVGRVKSIPDRVDLFVCSQDTYKHCKEKGIKLSSAMLNIEEHSTPLRMSTPPPEYQPVKQPDESRYNPVPAGGVEFEEVRQEDLPERFRASPQQQRASQQQAPARESSRSSDPPPPFPALAAAAAPAPVKPPAAAAAAPSAARGGDPVGGASLEEVRARLGQSKRNQVKMMGNSFADKYSMFEAL